MNPADIPIASLRRPHLAAAPRSYGDLAARAERERSDRDLVALLEVAAAIVDRILERSRILPRDAPWLGTRHLGLGDPAAADASMQPVIASGSGRSDPPEPTAGAVAGAIAMAKLLARVAALEEPGPADPADPEVQLLRREAEFWTIAYAGQVIRLRDMRGLHYLETLLRHPGREFHAGELVAARNGELPPGSGRDGALRVAVGLGDAGEVLDGRACAAYRRRLAELAEQLSDAERCNDLGRLERARAEREALVRELGAAARGRRAASHAERARIAVSKAIKLALAKIAASHPALGAHLAATVRRGYFCAYLPDPRRPIDWLG